MELFTRVSSKRRKSETQRIGELVRSRKAQRTATSPRNRRMGKRANKVRGLGGPASSPGRSGHKPYPAARRTHRRPQPNPDPTAAAHASKNDARSYLGDDWGRGRFGLTFSLRCQSLGGENPKTHCRGYKETGCQRTKSLRQEKENF